MKINPGGRLDTQDVRGRDAEIARYWRVLERQGLVLSAERRIGKTHIVRKMRAECPENYLPFYQDLERVHTIRELVRATYRAVGPALAGAGKWKSKLAEWSSLVPERLGSIDLPTTEKNWQGMLTTLFDDVIGVAADRSVLVLWDEFPLMLYNLRRREGEDLVIELLDQLRELRQRHAEKVRFLLTGSIGLHLVLRSLRKAGNANAPVNDMYAETVPPMGRAETLDLTRALLEEVAVVPSAAEAVAASVVEQVGGFPYYIHHVADELEQLGRAVVAADVDAAVDRLLYDGQDTADFGYYASRLSTYYEADEHALALTILDCLAGEREPKDFATIVNLCRHRGATHGDEQIRAVVGLLVADHYLERSPSPSGAVYGFRWRLVQRWWRGNRL